MDASSGSPPAGSSSGDGGQKDWRKPKSRRGQARRGGRRRRKRAGPDDRGGPAKDDEVDASSGSAAELDSRPADPRQAPLPFDEPQGWSKAQPPSDAQADDALEYEDDFGVGILDEAKTKQARPRLTPREGVSSAGMPPAHGALGHGGAQRQAALGGSMRTSPAPAREARAPSEREFRQREPRGRDDNQRGARPPRADFAPEKGRADRPGENRPARPDGPSRRERFGPKRTQAEGGPDAAAQESSEGMFVQEKGGYGILRLAANQFLSSKDDVFVPPHLVARHKLTDGALVKGRVRRHNAQHKWALEFVDTIDGKDPRELAELVPFKKLTSIDPDFHYAVGDATGDVSMRIMDIICPVGRGTRGLIVAPPRSGKTILMRKFAAGIEKVYPETQLFVLLVDERPEEATEWQRSIQGKVFVSTNDESSKNHVELAEAVWKRCTRLVELGQDVVLLLDSITRLARAYNNMEGGSGRTMSGGLDSRAMERPRAFFGSARNTETAGSLTILGTTLVDTGSRLDQMVFEEFKGTGNMELVLSRKLADRRIFPAIDVEKSGTRKEEKLISARRLKQIHILRRVLLKMNFVEAMELLVDKLENVEKTDEFLKRFEVDPEA